MTLELLKSVLITSLMGSLLTVVITFIKPITKKRFGYGWHYYIWLAVLIVMILPLRFTYPTTAGKAEMLPKAVAELPVTMVNETVMTVASPIVGQPPVIEQIPQSESSIITDLLYDWADNLTVIWILGIFIMMSVNIIGYIGLMYRVHKNSVVISCPEIRKYTKRKAVVRVCKNLSSPFVMGIFRPALILPDIQLSKPQLDNILIHETTHLNRNDVLYKWFTAFVKALHWFNPFIYYAENQINTECEISCDMTAVRDMDNTQTADYVNTIISLLSAHKARSIPLTTGMTGSKNTLKKRFAMLKNKFSVNKKVMIISIVSAALIFVFALCVSGFLNGKWAGLYNNTIELNTDSRSGDEFNTLLLGVDEQNRADSIMLIKMTGERIEGVSIPRSSVFNGGTISHILSQENGDQKVIDAVRQKLSVPITYYARIKMDFVRDLIDATGGLTADIPMDMKYDDSYKDLHIDLKKGNAQALNGEQVCHLLQFRHSNDGTGYPQDDLDRIKIAQQLVIDFMSQNKISQLVISSKNIIESINANVVTNYSVKSFIKDSRLLSGKKLVFKTIPGNPAVNNGVFEYEINPAVESDGQTENEAGRIEQITDTTPTDNSIQTLAYTEERQNMADTAVNNTPDEALLPEKDENPGIAGFEQSERLNFSSVAEAEAYLQSGGKAAVNENFKAGSNYIADDYTFENSSNETISNISCNDNGEVTLYFNANLDSLMSVSFTDTETKDKVNSAIILTGKDRIYKFTGLDPSRQYDVELNGITEDEWKIEGQYIIF